MLRSAVPALILSTILASSLAAQERPVPEIVRPDDGPREGFVSEALGAAAGSLAVLATVDVADLDPAFVPLGTPLASTSGAYAVSKISRNDESFEPVGAILGAVTGLGMAYLVAANMEGAGTGPVIVAAALTQGFGTALGSRLWVRLRE